MAERTRFLVVDDKAGLLEMELDDDLRVRFELLTATTRAEAVDTAAAHEPEIIIVDRDLPDADGYELVSQLREEHSSARFLITAPSDSDAEQKAAREAGADGVLVKPFNATRLKTGLYEVLNLHRRTHPRVAVEISVDYAAGEDVFLEKSVNLSMGGMFIRTGTPLAMGTTVQLRFHVPGIDREIQITGHVAWVQSFIEGGPADQYPGMGISFDEFRGEDAVVLRNFVVRRLQDLGIENE